MVIQDSQWTEIRAKFREDHIADGARQELRTVWLDFLCGDDSAAMSSTGLPIVTNSMADLGEDGGVEMCDD